MKTHEESEPVYRLTIESCGMSREAAIAHAQRVLASAVESDSVKNYVGTCTGSAVAEWRPLPAPPKGEK